MAVRNVFDNEKFTPDGETMIRDAISPGGTYFGKQTHANTPSKRNKARQYEFLPNAAAGEAAELRKATVQSSLNARKKLKGAENQMRQPASLSLFAQIVWALAGAVCSRASRMGFGTDRLKSQNSLSQDIR